MIKIFVNLLIKYLLNKSIKENNIIVISTLVSQIFRGMLEVGVFLTCAILIGKDKLSNSFFIAMTYYIYQYTYIIQAVTDFGKRYQELDVSMSRINEILFNEKYEDVKYGNKSLDNVKGIIKFNNVSFSYPNEKEILNNFNITFEPNKKIAIVGSSGEGKSTLFNLITRLFDPTSGTITLDDIDIKELSTLLSTSKFLTEEEREKVSKHFKLKLKQQKRRMEDENKISSYQYIIKEVLDFRRWFEFKLMYTTPRQNKKELTDNEFYRLSGGEKALAMYIPLFAAVNARYDGADKKDCPRMISLDEAFAGVDEENISHMFNLMEGLDLDYVLNSQVLWGTYEGVKNLAIYELIREGSDMVIPIKYTWNGHSKIVDLGE